MSEIETTRKAVALCKELGTEWVPEVWENIGWYYAAVLNIDEGYIKVYPKSKYGKDRKFWVDSRLPEQLYVYASDPKEGVSELLAKAKGRLEKASKIVEALERIHA